jgi:hypothetical protein
LKAGEDRLALSGRFAYHSGLYTELCTMPAYSGKAQPYLDAIAESVFTSQDVRDWMVAGTPMEANYAGSVALIDEQRAVRWRTKPTKQPFWANYWCGRNSRCTCRIEGSKAIESDAISFSE